jgi:hypothetical protein
LLWVLEYLVMPFRLANTPATFQNLMKKILWHLIDQEVVVYIDDILIYTHDMKQYKILVKEVLTRVHV